MSPPVSRWCVSSCQVSPLSIPSLELCQGAGKSKEAVMGRAKLRLVSPLRRLMALLPSDVLLISEY